MNEKVFIPAIPVTVPVTPIDVPNHPRPGVPTQGPADAQSQTPASATKKVSSRMMVGTPSKSPPPHINPPQHQPATKVVTSKKA